MSTKTKVMIVDDSALVRQVITQAISRDPSIEVVATAQDPIFALEKLKRCGRMSSCWTSRCRAWTA